MKIIVLAFLLLFVCFLFQQQVYADTTIAKCHTSIHTETNGIAQDYESDTCDSTNIQSNGTKIEVNNNTTPPTITVPTLFPTIPSITVPTLIATPSIDLKLQKQRDTAKEKIEKQRVESLNFFQHLELFFKNLLSFK